MNQGKAVLLNNPYGQVAYEKFHDSGLAFADKSAIIQELDKNSMTPYPVLLRPRRFGKSTFVQMLKCFYDISYKERYDDIFSGKAVYDADLPSHNTYHVIDFDFSGVSGQDKETLTAGFITALDLGLADFCQRYPDFIFSPAEAERKTPSSFIRSFFKAYKLYPSRRAVYLMVDEYDNFANSVLSQDLELFQAITGTGGFLKDFYAAVKEGAKTCVAKTFITGVSSVSLDSLTSGFNISLNVTADKCLNEYAGFTESELAVLIPQLVDLEQLGISVDEVISRMKPVFDGYRFSRLADNTLYNSSMCLFYLRKLQNEHEFLAPEDCMDPASDHDGSKLQQLFAIAADGVADEIVENYLDNELFFVDQLAENINLNKTANYSREQLLSMLYYLGYLTIDREASDGSSLALKIPNLFMSKLFAQCIADMRLRTSQVFADAPLDISSLREASDDISSFAASCTEFLSSIFTCQVLSHMSEMALNLTLYTKLKSLRGIFVEMQKSLRTVGQGEKFADLVITVNKGKSSECVYLFELKYSSKAEATEARIQKLIRTAVKQVGNYKSALEFRNRQIRAYAMIFAGSDCVYCG